MNKYSPRWYDRKGKPLVTVDSDENLAQWKKEMKEVDKLLRNRDYKIIKQEHLWWGGWLSTVWLGLDFAMSFNDKKHTPLIFESMLFPPNRLRDMDMSRYSTERQAIKGHERMKKEWSSPLRLVRYAVREIAWRLEIKLIKLKNAWKS